MQRKAKGLSFLLYQHILKKEKKRENKGGNKDVTTKYVPDFNNVEIHMTF